MLYNKAVLLRTSIIFQVGIDRYFFLYKPKTRIFAFTRINALSNTPTIEPAASIDILCSSFFFFRFVLRFAMMNATKEDTDVQNTTVCCMGKFGHMLPGRGSYNKIIVASAQ